MQLAYNSNNNNYEYNRVVCLCVGADMGKILYLVFHRMNLFSIV